jgi:hypothetical protein
LKMETGQLHLRELKSNVILEDLRAKNSGQCNDVACDVACNLS